MKIVHKTASKPSATSFRVYSIYLKGIWLAGSVCSLSFLEEGDVDNDEEADDDSDDDHVDDMETWRKLIN